jgi:hypothetical protein
MPNNDPYLPSGTFLNGLAQPRYVSLHPNRSPPPNVSAHLPSFNYQRSCYQTAFVDNEAEAVVNSVKWSLLLYPTSFFFWLSCLSINSFCCTINQIGQKVLQSRLFISHEIIPLFPKHPIHSITLSYPLHTSFCSS